MKVLMVNGSAKAAGCTARALREVGETLKTEGIDYEIYQLGGDPIKDCTGCGACRKAGKCIFKDPDLTEFLKKAEEADGFVFGTPVYYAHPSGRLLSFLDRVFYSAGKLFTGKPGAAVCSSRRAGDVCSMDVINKYFTINAMPIASSTYWNGVHGSTAEQVEQDAEGLQTMRNIGHSMAALLKNDHKTVMEKGNRTDFIR